MTPNYEFKANSFKTPLLYQERNSHRNFLDKQNNILYIYGGRNVLRKNDLWKIDFSQKNPQFQLVEEEGKVPTCLSCVMGCIYKDHLYIFGGWAEKELVSDMFKYGPLSSTQRSWISVDIGTIRPSARRESAYGLIEDTFYIIGGSGKTDLLADVWAFDMIDHRWQLIQENCGFRSEMDSCTLINDEIYVYGGQTSDGPSTQFFKFDPKRKSITILPNPTQNQPGKKQNSAVTSIGSRFFVLHGGYDWHNGLSKELFIFDIHSNIWLDVTLTHHIPATLTRHQMTYLPNLHKLFLTSGWNSYAYKKDSFLIDISQKLRCFPWSITTHKFFSSYERSLVEMILISRKILAQSKEKCFLFLELPKWVVFLIIDFVLR